MNFSPFLAVRTTVLRLNRSINRFSISGTGYNSSPYPMTGATWGSVIFNRLHLIRVQIFCSYQESSYSDSSTEEASGVYLSDVLEAARMPTIDSYLLLLLHILPMMLLVMKGKL